MNAVHGLLRNRWEVKKAQSGTLRAHGVCSRIPHLRLFIPHKRLGETIHPALIFYPIGRMVSNRARHAGHAAPCLTSLRKTSLTIPCTRPHQSVFTKVFYRLCQPLSKRNLRLPAKKFFSQCYVWLATLWIVGRDGAIDELRLRSGQLVQGFFS